MVQTQVRSRSIGFVETRIGSEDALPERDDCPSGQPEQQLGSSSVQLRIVTSGTTIRSDKSRIKTQHAKKAIRFTLDGLRSTFVVTVLIVACAMGIIYLAAFAGVWAKANQIHNLTLTLKKAQDQGESLIESRIELTRPARISKLAQVQGMVMASADQYNYVSVPTATTGSEPVTQIALAR